MKNEGRFPPERKSSSNSLLRRRRQTLFNPTVILEGALVRPKDLVGDESGDNERSVAFSKGEKVAAKPTDEDATRPKHSKKIEKRTRKETAPSRSRSNLRLTKNLRRERFCAKLQPDCHP